MTNFHLPVLLSEVLESFEGCKLKRFMDGTVGAGGHAEAILTKHSEIQRFYAFDQDTNALTIAKKTLSPWPDQVQFIHDNFSSFPSHLTGIQFDGILADLGVSSMQLDTPERGFSFMKDGPLDMRMNPKAALTAADIVNTYSERALGEVLRRGEEKKWRLVAKILVKERELNPIVTTKQLTDLLFPYFQKEARKKKIHPLTLVFQALRMEVNHELEVLESFLAEAIAALAPKGRLAIITFHSLEDRLVKNAFREAASDKVSTAGIAGVFLDKDPLVRLITRKPLEATDEEIIQNPRSRCAKLRVVEKLG